MTEIDWEGLRGVAVAMMRNAYAPYSKFPVGAASVVDDGRVVRGCNVENAVLGLGFCAECSMVADLMATGGGRLVAMVCVDGKGDLLMPCGRCRQLLLEHGGKDMLIAAPDGPLTLDFLMPRAFGPENLR